MKKTFFRLSALVLALLLLLTMFVSCNKSDGTIDNGGNPDDNDNPTVIKPIQTTTTIYEIAKHGNLVLYMYGKDLYDKGFEHGDIVEIAIGDKKWDVPLCTSYSDVNNGEAVLRATGDEDGVVLAINMGDFATTAGIAKKSAIDEEPGYRWDYLMESPVEITITMKKEGGYREEWLIRQLVRTNERADYAHLSDEAFANFRVIETTGMGKGVLYRSSSPINPELGRNTYADKAAEKAGIITVVNLADPSNMYEGTENTYYSTCKVTYVNLGMDFLSEATLNGMAEGMRFIINNNGPYLIHCNEGKDRAGFVSALLECLMGATLDEVIDDYMLTYYNYYGVEKGTEKYDAVLKNNLIKALNTTFKVDDVYKADLAAEAAAFLMEDAGLTADEVSALKGKLTITLQEIYDACQNEALLKNRESVYIRNDMDGEFWLETYLTKDYIYDYMPDEEFPYVKFMTDDACYRYDSGNFLHYLFITPDGVGDFASERAEAYAAVILGEEALDDIIESVEIKDGRITVTSVLSSKNLEDWAEYGVIAGKYKYVLDAKTREMISISIEYTYNDGSVSTSITELSYDAEEPEKLSELLGYVNQTEDLRNVTVVSNPGTDKEESKSIQAPKGLVVGVEYGDDLEYAVELFTDAACTVAYDPFANTDSDLTIYIKWSKQSN
ncbi:MAG: tyrosine-protein phosphatase [Clostridia bacterium]|nr:tyrosine-protein phosphatase [Clostridia bacterium]